MSVFLEILGSIFGRNDKGRKDRDHQTSQGNPSVESASHDTSVRGKSSDQSCNDQLRQSDPTKIYYYEYYPNLSISNSSAEKKPNTATLQSKHEYTSLRRASEVSQSLNSSSKLPQSSLKQTSSSSQSSFSAPKTPTYFAQSSTSSEPPSSSVKPSACSTGVPPFTYSAASSFKQSQSFSNASPSSCGISQSSSGLPASSQKAPPSSKPTLSALHIDSTNQHTKASYTVVQKDTSPIYMIPKDIEGLIKKDIVPDALKKPLSPSTYKDYFAALLYAEDFYIEKWSKFQLFNVTLELHEAALYNKSSKNKNLTESDKKHEKVFVAFEIDSVPERRPFLLSRDFVFAVPSGSKTKQFQGFIYRVVKSNIVLVEFEEDFYFQHHSDRKYDISFSFNRVCLKRAHQAIAAASGPSFQNYLFPDCASREKNHASLPLLCINYKLDSDQNSAVRQILKFQGSPPYLVEGPLSVTEEHRLSKPGMVAQLSRTGMVVQEAVIQIYHRWPKNRILICAPTNRTCDALMGSLKEEIPESFRANAAFREIDGVPIDILPLCAYEGECFSCPPLEKLKQFRVIFSTFTSSFRLHNEGITSGHFSHIFLVDASSAIEPETIIALSSLANENTSVIVTGDPRNHSSWVRSDIARRYGLRISYFERLRRNKTYKTLEPTFITLL